MKNSRKALLFGITFIMLSVFVCTSNASAAAAPEAYAYSTVDYVNVSGNAGAECAGLDATLMLVRSSADLENLTDKDIGYIGQEKVKQDGSYKFEFGFSDFEYGDNGDVTNMQIVLSLNGEKKTTTVKEAKVLSNLVSFDLDISKFGKAITEIRNPYGLPAVRYKLYVGFYDENGKLLNVRSYNDLSGDSTAYYGYKDVPEGTSYAKGFLWDPHDRLIPLAPAVEEGMEERPLKILMIGNSLTVDATRWLTNLTKEGDLDLKYKTKVFGAATIIEHAANLEAELNGRTVAEAENGSRMSYGTSRNYTPEYSDNCLLSTPLRNEKFDVVVIQAYDSDGGGFVESDFETLGNLVSQIRSLQPEAEIVIYESWLFWNGNKEIRDSYYQEKYADIISKVKENIPIEFGNITPGNRPLGYIPVAEAFNVAYDRDEAFSEVYPAGDEDLGNLTLEWTDENGFKYGTGLYRDFAHASYYGCYLSHAVWYEFLTGQKAPTVNAQGEAIVGKPDAVNDTEHMRRLELLSDIAHEVMSDKKSLPELW